MCVPQGNAPGLRVSFAKSRSAARGTPGYRGRECRAIAAEDDGDQHAATTGNQVAADDPVVNDDAYHQTQCDPEPILPRLSDGPRIKANKMMPTGPATPLPAIQTGGGVSRCASLGLADQEVVFLFAALDRSHHPPGRRTAAGPCL